jgi:hypothetical protein
MPTTVDLDDNPVRVACEISEVRADCGLSAKVSQSGRKAAKTPPQFFLGVCHRSSQVTRAGHPGIHPP